MAPQFLEHNDQRIAYQHHPADGCGVLFLPGFRSDMTGSKAQAVAEWCRTNSIGFTALDYRAHGASDGDFRDFTIGGALEDTLHVLDTITKGPQILIGSSMGGWIALLAARARAERIAGMIGIAAAPDFTERLIWGVLSDDKRRQMEEEGELRTPNHYDIGDMVYTHALILDGRKHLLLEDALPLSMPVRLLQGMQDNDVPWQTALDIANALAAEDVRVTLIKDGEHRLSRMEDLNMLISTLGQLHQTVGEGLSKAA